LANYGKFSPIIRQKLPDYPANDSRWNDWLDEQEYYILNGFQVGGEKITGSYYFHLNFAKLKILDENNYETLASPYHVDVYNDLFNFIENCEKTGTDGFVWKARDKGFSYSMTSKALKETQFHENNNIVALFPKGEQVKHLANFRDKYDTSWNGLPACMRHNPGLKNSEDTLHYGWYETDEETKERRQFGLQSKISFMKVVNKDVAKSFRAKWIIVDEAGEIDCLIPLIMANRANMKKGATKFGTTIIGGTSNSNHKGYKDVCELWHNAHHYKFDKFKILAQQALFGFEKGLDGKPEPFINFETGESLQEKALTFLNKELEAVKKTKNKEAEMEHRQNYPTNEDDMFLRFTTSNFKAELLSKQRSEILTNKTLTDSIDVGTLFMTIKDGKRVVKFKHDVNGHWKILKHPSKTLMRKDVGAVDGYKLSQSDDSDSEGAIMIYRDFQGAKEVGNLPICIYLHRPETKDDFNYHAMLTAMYFDCQLLYEVIDEDMINYFIANGMEKHLAKRPNLLTEMGSTTSNKYGVIPSAHNKAVALEYAVEEFEKYFYNIAFVELIDDLANFGIKNTDLAMAYLWCVLHAKNNATYFQRKENAPAKKPTTFIPYAIREGSGIKWITTLNDHELLQKQQYGISFTGG